MGIEWSRELTSGIDTIDVQHKNIIHLLNLLVTAQTSSTDSDELVSCLINFTRAIEEHFDFEEALLEEYGYRGLKQHKAGHEEISEILNSITLSAMLDEASVFPDLIDNVVKWFEEHLTSEDIKYFKVVKQYQEPV